LTETVCKSVLQTDYVVPEGKTNKSDLDDLLRRASHNRVLYIMAQNLLRIGPAPWEVTLQDVVLEGEKRLNKLSDTLVFLASTLPTVGIDYLVVKTYRYVPYVTFDVDVLVWPEQFENTKQVFAKERLAILKHPGESVRKQSNCERKDLLRIDLHQGFYWQGFSYLDADLAWQDPVYRQIEGIEAPIPSIEVEVLLNIVHLLYERRYVTLLDLIYFRQASQEGCRWEIIQTQARKYGWEHSLQNFRAILNSLTERVWDTEIAGPKAKLPTKTNLPYMIPPWQVWGFFFEKARATRSIPWFDFAYYHYATARYYLTGQARLPFYLHWYPIDRFSAG
jgi:hypothetical protein